MLHGGDLTTAMARHGGCQADWLDLSTGINPHAYPYAPDIAAGAFTRLPGQAEMDRLLAAARGRYGVTDGTEIVAAPGTQALIQWLPVLAPEGTVGIVGPTYGEHAASWRRCGRQVIECDAVPPLPEGVHHLVIVSPNNPDGHLFGLKALCALAGEIARRGGWLVIDEAFIDIMPEATAAGLCADFPVVVLRSFGKFYGLAGIRLGFLIASRQIAARFEAALGPWPVAGPALVIGAAALSDGAWAAAMCARLAEEGHALDLVLRGAGLDVVGGTALFRLVRHVDAADIHRRLAGSHIWVRRFDHDTGLLRFGLPPGAPARDRLWLALGRHVPPSATVAQGTSTG